MLTGCPSCTKAGESHALASSERGMTSTSILTAVRLDVAAVAKVVSAGTAVGFLTGLFGVGGGFVIVPALTLVLGFAMPEAIGTSLVVISINAAAALVARIGTGDLDVLVTGLFTLAALGGVLAGSRVADRLPARGMLRWFAVLLVAVAAYTGTRSILALAEG